MNGNKVDFYKQLVQNSLIAIRQCKQNLANAREVNDENTVAYISEHLFNAYDELVKRTELLVQEIDELKARLENNDD